MNMGHAVLNALLAPLSRTRSIKRGKSFAESPEAMRENLFTEPICIFTKNRLPDSSYLLV